MCGNARRYWGEKTYKELKTNAAMDYQMNDASI